MLVRILFGDADIFDFEILHGLLVNRIAPFVRKNWPYCQRSRFSQLGQHHRLTWPERLDVAAQDWKLSDSPARCARLVYSGASRPEKGVALLANEGHEIEDFAAAVADA